jgi:peptidoglycan/LPS O-acetylase OafA/YrhL
VVRPPRLPLAVPGLLVLGGLLAFRRYADAALAPGEALRFAIQYGVCAAMALVLVGWRSRPPRWAVPLAGFNRTVADFSYSLYLTHFPVMILLVAALGTITANPGYATGFMPTDPVALATYAGEVTLAFAFAWLFAQATERQTARVRGFLKRRFGGDRGRPKQV